MSGYDFSRIAPRYNALSTVQGSAGETLLAVLDVRQGETVLDLGCGTGTLTRELCKRSGAAVTALDPSEGMIAKARENCAGLDVAFAHCRADELAHTDCYDVVFCNSTLQWLNPPDGALARCRAALKEGGRIGIQAPAKGVYCPAFVDAIDGVRRDGRTGPTFARFKNPWFFRETAEEYAQFFDKAGFAVHFAEIKEDRQRMTPQAVFGVFSSGAIAGYLNPACYDAAIDAAYEEIFKEIVAQSFQRRAEGDGKFDLVFFRIYLVASRPRDGRT